MNKRLLNILIVLIAIAAAAGIYYANIKEKPIVEEFRPGIFIYNFEPGQLISSPLKIEGYINGNGWTAFEAQAGTVELVDTNGKRMAFGLLTSVGEWMRIPSFFETTLDFGVSTTETGELIFKNENASGLPEFEREYRVSVKFSNVSAEVMTVKAFFLNDQLDPEITCVKVFPVERQISKTTAVARAALEELLKGPTSGEKLNGYITTINQGVKIQSLVIENGVARVDFDETLEKAVGGSCRVAAIRWQIVETLKQFSSVNSVIISINGRTEDILQP